MPKYVIEREVPGAGSLSRADRPSLSIMRRPEKARPADSMGAQLCDWRQNLLHLHRAK